MRSMTGFGRERIVADGKEYQVEIRSVNSRYCELTAKLPRNYTYVEEKLKALVKKTLSRGKAEVSLTVYDITGRDTSVTVNTPVVKRYLDAVLGMPNGASAVVSAFLMTTIIFGAMSVYAMKTSRDLASWGRVLFISVIVILIGSVVNIFLGSPLLQVGSHHPGILHFHRLAQPLVFNRHRRPLPGWLHAYQLLHRTDIHVHSHGVLPAYCGNW